MAIYATIEDGMGQSGTLDSTGNALTAFTGVGANDFSHISEDFLTAQGVTSGLTCVENGTPDRSVDVNAGTGYILNTDWTANNGTVQKYHRFVNTADVNVAIDANATGNPRITSIFAKYDTSATPDDNASNVVTFVAVNGTAAATPVAPSAPADGNYYLRLADVACANGFSAITNANITDRRILINPSHGWTPVLDTWVYASATTFTIAGADRTNEYRKGGKIRFKQGGAYKYMYILSSAFSTNTTVTVTGGSDYTIANSAITDNYVSYEVSPLGYPDTFNYTPANTNITIGNGSYAGKFKIADGIVYTQIYLSFGSTSSFGGAIQVGLPTTHGTYIAGTSTGMCGIAGDVSTNNYYTITNQISASNKIYPIYTAAGYGLITATAPFTWATGDFLTMSGSYYI